MRILRYPELCGPILYFHRRDGKIIYIGTSRRGLARPLERTFKPGDELLIFDCADYEEALYLERELSPPRTNRNWRLGPGTAVLRR